MSAQIPRRKQPRLQREEFRVILLWALVVGVAFGLSWCGCRPPQTKRPTPPKTALTRPAPKLRTPTRCRVVYTTATPCVRVVIRRDCLANNVTDILFIQTYLQDNGRQAALDAADILLRYFGELPELATMAMTVTPDGYPAYLFVIVGFNGPELKEIERYQKLKHIPK